MKGISLKIIGSGDAFSTGGRFQTCFYVQSISANFLIDCGATAFTSLKKNGIDQEDIDFILISHFHGDHYGGLPFIILDAAVHNRRKPLTIICPEGGKEHIQQLLNLLYPGSNPMDKIDIIFKYYRSNQNLKHEQLNILPMSVKHTNATFPHALRIQISDKVIAYSGDTEWTSNLIEIAKDADVFICECNFYKKKISGHLNYETIQKMKNKLTCKKIILTHLGEEMLAMLPELTIPYAVDGLELDI